MMLAGTFEASDGGPTVLLYLIVAAFSIAAAISVLVGLRWHDRRQLDRRRQRRAQAEKPWLELIEQDSERLERLETAVVQILDVAAERYPEHCIKPNLRLLKNS